MGATETTILGQVVVDAHADANYYAHRYLELTAFEVAANVKSAHLEAKAIVVDALNYGEEVFVLVMNLDFTAFEPADVYAISWPGGRALQVSQAVEVSGSVTIEPLPDGSPLPSGVPTVLLTPEDGKVGTNRSAIVTTRLIQPSNWPDPFLGVTGSTVARDLFSQTPVLN